MSKKKIIGYIKLTVPAGKAAPSQSIGSALGQKQLNIMEFCKAFNAATQDMEPGTPTPVIITAFEDKKFTFITKTPPASYYIKKFAGIEKGSTSTKKIASVGSITMDDCREIAKIKMKDLNANDIDAGARMIKGSAESMGLDVTGN